MIGCRGDHFWGGAQHQGDGPGFRAVQASTGEEFGPEYREASVAQVAAAVAAAAGAAEDYAAVAPAERAAFLRRIADNLEALGDELLELCERETALPRQRLLMERGRTVNQLRLFAGLVEEGSWVDARIDRAIPDRQPVPKPDLRTMLTPLGPVAVFGASNFPLAYSVAGGDTASALAAGCPVVVKGHPAHPGTSELVAGAIAAAVTHCGMPVGTFGLVHGRTEAVGRALVEAEAITAVGFTGSPQGGAALFRCAAARPAPIPVFAEMGSLNPVFVLPGALEERSEQIAQMLAASATLGSGQFCTCPGMVLHENTAHGERFVNALAVQLGAAAAGTMVHPSLKAGYQRAADEVRSIDGVFLRAAGDAHGSSPATAAGALLFTAEAETALRHGRLREEVFGPALVAVSYGRPDELLAIARSMNGYLTATVHGTAQDLEAHRELIGVLRRKVGRLLFAGVPTGVEVCTAMQHGGPWPASSDSRFTAVGPRAVLRWARPVCFQDAPAAVLPAELRDHNERGILRTIDGVPGRD